MKYVNLTLGLTTLALATASAATHYSFTLDSSKRVGDTQLQAGEYKIEVAEGKAIFKNGKTVVEVPAAVQTGDTKYSLTSYQSVDSKIIEIDLRGTNTKIVFAPVPVAATK